MKIKLLLVGKSQPSFVEEGIVHFKQRIEKYTRFEIVTIPAIKHTKSWPVSEVKKKEADSIKAKLKVKEYLVILDEKGKKMDSREFATFIEKQMSISIPTLTFLVGGAYGFDPAIYERCQLKLQLSAMTFSHQLIRLIFMEQLYRAFSIIRNEPYHNE